MSMIGGCAMPGTCAGEADGWNIDTVEVAEAALAGKAP